MHLVDGHTQKIEGYSPIQTLPSILGPPCGQFGVCSGVVSGERGPPAPLGLYLNYSVIFYMQAWNLGRRKVF